MSRPDWNERYSSDHIPWDTGRPDGHLVDLVEAGDIRPGSVLEVGCGTGTNALWLAGRGFEVLGIDLAPLAIDRARRKRDATGVDCEFRVADFLNDGLPGRRFDLVFDRGCFHSFDHADERDLFAERVSAALEPDGRWVSLIGSTEGPERDSGPPRRSVRDIAAAVEPHLELVSLRATHFDAELPTVPTAWLLVARRRRVPAQPSTLRD